MLLCLTGSRALTGILRGTCCAMGRGVVHDRGSILCLEYGYLASEYDVME